MSSKSTSKKSTKPTGTKSESTKPPSKSSKSTPKDASPRPSIPLPERPPPTKAEITAFIKENFKPSLDLSIIPKNLDPVVDLYNFDPKALPFAQDNAKGFKLTLIPPNTKTVSEDLEKAALLSLLQLHSTWIRFTDPFEGKSRIYCMLTKKEIVPMLTTLREFFAAQLFTRAWGSKVGKSVDSRIAVKQAEAKKAKLEKKQQQTEKQTQSESSDSEDEASLRKTKKARNSTNNTRNDDDQLVQLGYSDDELPLNRNAVKTDGNPRQSAYSDNEEGDQNDQNEQSQQSQQQNEDGFKKRYIVFVGNLDYATTKKDLQKLFEKCDILDIRLSTNKLTKQSNGYAFVEFKTASNVHHALGYDLSEVRGRKVNIELTAAGGGNSKKRRQKIEQKRATVASEKAKRFDLDTSRYSQREGREGRRDRADKRQ